MKMETCSDCGYIFPEIGITDNDPRAPCPKCSSTRRTFHLEVHDSILLLSSTDVSLVVNSAPPFSFGAIVKLERKVPDGQIIKLIDPVYTHLVNELTRNPQLIYQIDSRKWEEIIAAAYDKEGFDEVILTPSSGDRGRDVIAIKHGFGSVRFIDQVKRYKPGHVVKADEVRALIGVLAIFTTTSTFAPRIENDGGIKPYIPYRLELIDKEKLLKRLISQIR
jgi:restriction system protein